MKQSVTFSHTPHQNVGSLTHFSKKKKKTRGAQTKNQLRVLSTYGLQVAPLAQTRSGKHSHSGRPGALATLTYPYRARWTPSRWYQLQQSDTT